MNKTPQPVVPLRTPEPLPVSALRRPLPTWVVRSLAVLLVIVLLMLLPAIPKLHVYERHFGRDNPKVQLRLDALRADMDENAVLAHFPASGMRCVPEAGSALGDRVCWAAIGAADAVPALTVALFLRGGRLRHALVQVPWWAHGRLHARLAQQWGQAPASRGGVTMWTMPNGARLEVDTRRSINPLNWSTLMWTAPARG